MNCKNCRHWKGKLGEEYEHWGDCAPTENFEGGTAYHALKDLSTLAFAQDGERYHAWLITHETFGCVQFKDKDDF